MPTLPPPPLDATPPADGFAASSPPLVAPDIQWGASARQRGRAHRVVALVAVLLLVGVAVVSQVGWRRVLGPLAPPEDPARLHERILSCAARADWACVEEAGQAYVAQVPRDGRMLAHLGLAQNRQMHHAAAVQSMERAIALGEGAYDLFAAYAQSLAQVGRIDDAIAWDYKALAVVPRLVDVRGALATLLLQKDRRYEALSLLQSFDAGLAAEGHGAYFTGQRLSIEDAIEHAPQALDGTPATGASGTAPAGSRALRLPAYAGHFRAPVTLGSARSVGFMVDTGATTVAIDRRWLLESHAAYRVLQPLVMMRTADGRLVEAQGIVLSTLTVGGVRLRDVPATACDGCQPLLGQSALSRFDLRTTRADGVEFLTLTPRAGT